MKTELLELAGLTTRVFGEGPLTIVLLHGFGAPGDDLVGLGPFLDVPARFVFPAAPIELGGLYGDSRAWWHLDLMKLEQELQSGGLRDHRDEVPEGLAEVRAQVTGLLGELKARYGVEDNKLVLGGFSQGAMLSLDVALHRDTAPAGLLLMSGTLLAEAEWTPRMARLAGVPVLQSHGRMDQLLPYAIAEVLRDKLTEAGAKVEFVPFAGGHEIPPIVLDRAKKLLRSL